jgi:hypothetical protein
MDEKWDAKVVYEVKGQMTFRMTCEWIGEKPERVGQIAALLQEGLAKFTNANSSVAIKA